MTLLPDSAIIRQTMFRIHAEYAEMPGLRLTCRQAQRLFGLEQKMCERVLDGLVALELLVRQPNGMYVRPVDRSDRAGWILEPADRLGRTA